MTRRSKLFLAVWIFVALLLTLNAVLMNLRSLELARTLASLKQERGRSVQLAKVPEKGTMPHLAATRKILSIPGEFDGLSIERKLYDPVQDSGCLVIVIPTPLRDWPVKLDISVFSLVDTGKVSKEETVLFNVSIQNWIDTKRETYEFPIPRHFSAVSRIQLTEPETWTTWDFRVVGSRLELIRS